MVLQKLVNSTNVVFHMLDLQPYAMVLPMDKLTSDRNKRKILSKILKNNPDTFSSYKSKLNHKHENHSIIHSQSDHNLKHTSTHSTSNTTENITNSPDTQDSTVVTVDTTVVTVDTTVETVDTTVETVDTTVEKVDTENVMEKEMEKEVKLEDLKIKQLPTDDHKTQGSDIFLGVKRFLDRLDSDQIIGCMIILAQKTTDKTSISPIAGGIVEVFDDYERSIQTLWLNNNITSYVNFINLKGKKNARKLISNLDDQILSKIVLSTLTLRLCAHAYQMTLPNSKRIQHKSRLISIYHQMGQTFPRFAYSFIKEEMQFSKHYEINYLAIKHNDNPKIPCRCLKPIDTPPDAGGMVRVSDLAVSGEIGNENLLFFGITESRFTGMYNSTYENILIGFMNLLSGKLSDISKIVRFDDTLNYFEEDEYKTKRHKVNFRSKRLQNRA